MKPEPASPPSVSRAVVAPPADSRLAAPLEAVVDTVPAKRRPIGKVLSCAATCLVVLAMFGLAVKVVLQPGRSPTESSRPVAGVAASAWASASSSAGSGEPMPRGDLPGWHQTFADDFTHGLGGTWGTYSGQPGGDPGGWFDPSHVTAHNGLLTIGAWRADTPNGNLYVSGGLSNARGFSQTYGRFQVRFRMDKGYGVSYVIQLWPTSDGWPPEVDFAEDDARNRDMISASQHYGRTDSLIHREMKGDFTLWHTAEVEWTPGQLVYRLDGKVWATMTNAHVPKVPMSIAIQTQAFRCDRLWEGCPNSTTPQRVNLQVDWVVAYSATL